MKTIHTHIKFHTHTCKSYQRILSHTKSYEFHTQKPYDKQHSNRMKTIRTHMIIIHTHMKTIHQYETIHKSHMDTIDKSHMKKTIHTHMTTIQTTCENHIHTYENNTNT